jgi:ribosome assembly protein 4
VSHTLTQLPRTTGKHLATGSGDTTVRFYDLDKELPAQQCKGHSNWVLCVSWAPDGTMVASGGMDGEVRVCV